MSAGVTGVSASAAIAAAVTGPVTEVTVLASFEHAAYLRHPDGLVALVTADGVQQPNALVLATGARERPLGTCRPGDSGTLGQGRLRLGDLRLAVTRWWRPQPSLRPVTATRLRGAVRAAEGHLQVAAGPAPPDLAAPLVRAADCLERADAAGAVVAARRLIGRGPGLTPAGDDVVAGLLAATRLLAPAVAGGDPAEVVAATRRAGVAVGSIATDATTAISAALLLHAARGEVAVPAGRVLRALTGREALVPALDALLAVGSTSGRDLALGLLAGGRVALAGGTPVVARAAPASIPEDH